MIDSAILLLREQGAAATTVDAVLAHSGAPRGSVYHHFPGGRRELLLAAVMRAGDIISGLIRSSAGGGPTAMLERFAELWRSQLVATNHRAGCPVLAIAVDHDPDDAEIAGLVRATMQRWTQDLEAGLMASGIDDARAARLAVLVLATVEGAVVLCRSQASTEPLDTVVAELRPLLVP